MKRLKIALITLFALLPFLAAAGQENKSSEKIKIVIDDGSGTKVVLDTVFINSTGPDSILLKNGEVVHIMRKKGGRFNNDGEGKNIVIAVSEADGKSISGKKKEITIISSDSAVYDNRAGKKERVYVYSRSGEGNSDNDSTFTYVTHERRVGPGHRFSYISSDASGTGAGTARQSFIIAKNGVVVTVEGSDEEQLKELSKEIESLLDAREASSVKETGVRDAEKKTTRKK